jgi:hypothetical protein
MTTITGERCEWWPAEDQPATGVPGEACPNLATLSVGAGNNWHLCDSCAALPRFRRLRRRISLREHDEH